MIGKIAAFAVVALISAGDLRRDVSRRNTPVGCGVATAAVREIDTLEAHKVQHTDHIGARPHAVPGLLLTG